MGENEGLMAQRPDKVRRRELLLFCAVERETKIRAISGRVVVMLCS